MLPLAKTYIPFVDTIGLFMDEAADADEDYLYSLRHVNLDGDAYKVMVPSKDGASSPEIIRYEQTLLDHNARVLVAGSECGGQRAPPPS
jgi:hypothetical protein